MHKCNIDSFKNGASEASKTNIMIYLIFMVVHGCFLIVFYTKCLIYHNSNKCLRETQEIFLLIKASRVGKDVSNFIHTGKGHI